MQIGVVAGLVLLGYAGALLALFVVQRGIVFNPSGGRPDLVAMAAPEGMREVTTATVDGLPVTSWYLPSTRRDGRFIVYFHGNAGNLGGRVQRILPYARAGYGVLLVGYRGYSGNPGQPSEAGLYADARAALDFLQGEGITPGQTVLFGESLGSAIATQMAVERPALALVLEAPFCSILLSARQRYRFLAFDFLIRDKFDTLSKITRVNKPLLLIHGERDRTTPVQFGRRLFAAAREPKTGFFPSEAGHGDLMQHGMPDMVLGFLEKIR